MTSLPAPRSRWLAALALLQVLALAFAVGLWWGQRQNTLFHNGAWTLGKGTGKFVFYTFEFLFRPLERGEVNLAADMGFQEILSARPEGPGRRLETLACSVAIAPAGYLWLELGVSGQSRLACRLSRRADYASGWYRYGPSGDLERFTPLEAPPALGAAAQDRVELLRGQGGWTVRVNGRALGAVGDDLPPGGSFGFRGSGDAGAAVRVSDVELRFSDPAANRSWSERETFRPRPGAAGTLAAALYFALATLLLRRWRRRVVGLLLSPGGRERLARTDEIGTTAVLVLLAAAIAVRPAAGVLIPTALLAAELVHLLGFGLGARGGPPAPAAGLGRAAVAFGAALALLAAGALARHGDLLGWGRYSTWQRLKNVHPDAFLLRPATTSSSPRFELQEPRRLLPGEPFFVEGGAWRGQLIRLEFVPPPAGTLDLAFQQQSFLTRGDPRGEELPIQRRLLRLTTRPEVAGGLARGTHKTPSPFAGIDGTPQPGVPNRLEVRSDDRGVTVVLNGRRTLIAAAKPLGHGETGLIAWDAPVEVRSLSVEPTAGQSFRERLLPLGGLLLPLLAVGAVWLVLRSGGALPSATVAALVLGGLVPVGAYLAATLPIERNTLLLLNRERTAWLNLALVAASLALPALVLFLRQRLRWAVGFFYLACGLVVAATLLFAIGQIAATRPELLRRWLPADDVVVPGELVEKAGGGAGPWYAQDRMIGASNYVWRQRFGTRQVAGARPAGSLRVFVMGGSQAWGSGAADSFSTFDQLLARRLAAQGLPADVYNAGVNGAGISRVRWTWEALVAPLSPDVLVLDIGLNDSAGLAMTPDGAEKERRRAALLDELAAVLDRARAGGVEVLLVREPMCQETPLRADAGYYAGLARVAAERGVTVVSPQADFGRLERDHLLWWDTAHLTPFGHEALSRALEAPLAEILRRRLGRGADEPEGARRPVP